jgi:signal transduction histidine kinase
MVSEALKMHSDKPRAVKFLLVDDLEDNLLVLEALLERPELELLKARSGREALELLLLHEVALALIDVQMPEMDGFELAELMRGMERTRHVPIIFVTAGLREPHRVFQGYDAGAVDFLFKPVDARILQHKARTFFELDRQRQELSAQLERLRQSEEHKERLMSELEDTLRFNETFVAAVGHDLRNPLNAILMAAGLLLARSSEPELLNLVERIRSSGKRMASMIDDLSDLARARLGNGLAVQREPADFAAMAKKVVQEHRGASPDRVIELELQGDLLGEWDGVRIEQALSNLIGNALRHGDKSRPVEVSLRGFAEDRVLAEVHNQGAIAPEAMPHLFDPFRRGKDIRGRSEGLGLGLYIVRQVVLAHGGEVEVESDTESGTTFRLILPRHRTSETVPADAAEAPAR